MKPESFAVRRMRADELGIIREWATLEGWNPGLHDAAAFFAADPDGFFVGELAGKAVSCVSCVAYDSGFGFLGQYIVQPAVRGRGYGVKTWAAGMSHLGGRNVGLDGVLAQQANYERSGFRFAHQHIRYEGTGGGAMPEGVVGLSAVPFDQIVAYDRTCFPAARPEFLRRWIALPDAAAFAVVSARALRGYGVIRRSVDGHKVGPLFADDPATAERLLRALWATAPGSRVCIDIPDDTANPLAGRLVQALSTRELFRTARMYTSGAPAVDGVRIFGITTMELG
jgi:hypothetical protein